MLNTYRYHQDRYSFKRHTKKHVKTTYPLQLLLPAFTLMIVMKRKQVLVKKKEQEDIRLVKHLPVAPTPVQFQETHQETCKNDLPTSTLPSCFYFEGFNEEKTGVS